MATVTLLNRNDGTTIRVFADAIDAQRVADAYNADPHVCGEPDPSVPYYTETWNVSAPGVGLEAVTAAGQPDTCPYGRPHTSGPCSACTDS